jgi:quinol monooxygenase YgiN
VVQDQADPNHFFFYEVYRNEAALEAHRKTPHYPRWRQAAEVCLAEPSQVTRAVSVFPRAYR